MTPPLIARGWTGLMAPCRILRVRGCAVAVSAMLLLAGCTAQTAGDEQTRTGSRTGFIGGQSLTQLPPAQRRPAPVITGPALTGDNTLSTAAYAGKVIVINVWGSWCAPCRKEAPDLAAASQQTTAVAQFVGLDIRDYDKAPAQAFVRAFHVPYPSIYDPRGTQLVKFTELPPSAIPSTLIIDRKGRIAARVIGVISKATLAQMINDMAAEP
jgi:thiol-disulfide isomerase/thioredoxin